MTPFVIPFPQIDPVLIEIGPLAIRWYSLAYIAGLVLGWRYIVMLVRNKPLWGGKSPATVEDIDDLLVWTTPWCHYRRPAWLCAVLRDHLLS